MHLRTLSDITHSRFRILIFNCQLPEACYLANLDATGTIYHGLETLSCTCEHYPQLHLHFFASRYLLIKSRVPWLRCFFV